MLLRNKKPYIAILLAAHNGIQWIKEQIETILNQQDVVVTVYISVDISTDETYEYCLSLEKRYFQIKILSYGEKYGGAAANFYRLIRDVDFSNFDYIAFSDQDDIWLPAKLIRAVYLLQQYSADVVSSDVIAFWEDGRHKQIKKSFPQRKFDFFFEAAGPGCTYVLTLGCASDFQSIITNRYSEIQKIHFHDWFCYAFARSRNYRWFIDPVPSVLYRQHANNQVGANSNLKGFFRRIKKITSGSGLEESMRIALILDLENEPFVNSWVSLSRWGIFRLAFKAPHARRKRLDQFFFFFACLLIAIIGTKSS